MKLKRCGWLGSAVVMIAMLVVAGACSGKKQEAAAPAGGSEASAAAATETAKPETAPANGAEVAKTGTGFVIKGSGNAIVGPVDLDNGCYIMKSRYQSSNEYSMLTLSRVDKFEGNDTEQNIAFVAAGLEGDRIQVLSVDKKGQPSVAYTFKVESEGTFTIELQTPPSPDTALAAPQTFTGGFGDTVTPLVKNSNAYIMLQVKYTGPEEGKSGGIPLVSGNLYDAETGDPVVRNQFCYQPGTVSEDGYSGQKPGAYFAVLNCGKKNGAWEATIKQ
jgi:hypothetical protein